jgi:hypothetical protein
MSRACNCQTDGQHYVRCTCCDEYVIEGEFEAHRHSCPGRPSKAGYGQHKQKNGHKPKDKGAR